MEVCECVCEEEDVVAKKIIEACSRNDYGEVFLILSEGGDPQMINRYLNRPLLHIACEYGNLESVQVLIETHNHDPTDEDDYGETAFHCATSGNHVPVLRYLLQNVRWNINCINQLGETPLHIATENKYVESSTILLADPRVNPNSQDAKGNTPLHYACCQDDLLNIVCLFAKHDGCHLNCQNVYGDSVLHIACRELQIDIIQFLVRQSNIDLNLRNSEDNTALHISCAKAHIEAVQCLVEHDNLNPNYQNCDGDTPLHVICKIEPHKSDIMERMVSIITSVEKCETNLTNNVGNTPLHIACTTPNSEVVRCLAEHGAVNPNIQNIDGDTPLHILCKMVQMPITVFTCLQQCDISIQNCNGDSPLHILCRGEKVDVIKTLLSQLSVDLNCRNTAGETVLDIACRIKNQDIIEILLGNEGCDPFLEYNDGISLDYLLYLACHNGNLNFMEVCAERCGTYVINSYRDSEGSTLLHLACEKYHFDLIKFLVRDCQLDPMCKNQLGNTVIHIASELPGDSITIIDCLIRECTFGSAHFYANNGEVLWKNNEGNTPLHLACCKGHVEIINILILNQGLYTLNCKNNDGATPLHILCANHQLDDARRQYAIQIFCKQQSLRCSQNSDGDTPLHIACRVNDQEMVKTLMQREDWNHSIQNNHSETAMHIVCENQNLEIIKILSNCLNTDFDYQNSNGDTPLHIACSNSNQQIVEILTQKKSWNDNITNSCSETPLHIACKNEDVNIVMILSKCPNINLNLQNSDGDTPLHIACRTSNQKIVKLLLQRKDWNPSIQNQHFETVLHIACEKLPLDTIKTLITEKKFNLNSQNRSGYTPLHIACYNNHSKLVELLTKAGRWNPNLLNCDGDTPLHIACSHCNMTIISILTETQDYYPNCQNSFGNTPLHISCEMEHSIAIQTFISNKACDPNKFNNAGETPLHIACRKNMMTAIHHLLQHENTDPNQQTIKDGNTALNIACANGNLEAATLLVQHEHCNPTCHNRKLSTPLHIACKFKYLHITKLLLDQRLCNLNCCNADGDSPLHIACKTGWLEGILALIAHCNCELNHLDRSGNTPLHVACQKGYTEVIRSLALHSRCNINCQNASTRSTPVHTILSWGTAQTECLNVLTDNPKCDINCQNYCGNTPLHIACLCGESEPVKFLMGKQDLDPNYQNQKGKTPLHIACSMGKCDIVKLLLSHQTIIPDLRDWSGNSGLDYACQAEHTEVIQYLINTGKVNCPTTFKSLKHILAMACRNGYLEILQFISKREPAMISSWRSDDHNQTLLHIACYNQQVATVKFLIAENASLINIVDTEVNTPIHLACLKDNFEITTIIFEHQDCAPNFQNLSGNTPLHIACMNKNTEIVRLLLSHEKIELNCSSAKKITPLHIVCDVGEVDIAELLLSHKDSQDCNPNCFNMLRRTPLHIACEKGNIELVRLLFSHKRIEPNCLDIERYTPLHIACDVGDTNIVQLLLSHSKTNPNHPCYIGNTPLHIACYEKNLEILNYLVLDDRTDPNSVDYHDGFTPLHIACLIRNVDLVNALLSSDKTNPNKKNTYGDTPLHSACNRLGVDISLCPNYTEAAKSAKSAPLNILFILLNDHRCKPPTKATLEWIMLYAYDRSHLALLKLLSERYYKLEDWIDNKSESTLLHLACYQTKYDVANFLIDECICNPYQENANKETPLSIAAKNDQTDLVKVLLRKQSIAINLSESENTTLASQQYYSAVLYRACSNHNLELFEIIIKQPDCNPNCQYSDGFTPLHLACSMGHLDIVKLLLSHPQINLNLQTSDSKTPLQSACFCSKPNMEIICLLLQDVRTVMDQEHRKSTIQQLFHIACGHGNMTLFNLLIAKQYVPSCDSLESGDSLIHVACLGDNSEMVQFLFKEYNFDPNIADSYGNTPLHIAYHYNKVQLLHILSKLENMNTNLQNKEGDTPLHILCRNSLPDVSLPDVAMLFKEKLKCNPNYRNNIGETPLHIACSRSDLNIIKFLLEDTDCNPNIADGDGNTAVHIACQNDQAYIVKQLCNHQHQNCSNIHNSIGNAPIHVACINSSLQVVQLLIDEFHFDPNLPANDGNSPLHIACRCGRKDIITFLTEKGCSLTHQNNAQDTSLHIACRYHGPTIVKLLIKSGNCGINYKNSDGDSPVHIACYRGHLDIVELLASKSDFNPNIQNENGDTVLHLLCNPEMNAAETDANTQDYILFNPDVDVDMNPRMEANVCYDIISTRNDDDDYYRYSSEDMPQEDYLYDLPPQQATSIISPQEENQSDELHECINQHPNPSIQVASITLPLGEALPQEEVENDDIYIEFPQLLKRAQEISPGEVIECMAPQSPSATCISSNCLSQEYQTTAPYSSVKETLTKLSDDKNQLAIVKLLTTHHGCCLNLQNKVGNTALHTAIYKRASFIAYYLIGLNSCDPMLPNSFGNTPLHIACMTGDLGAVNLLLSTGKVDPCLRNSSGQLPVNLAQRYKIIQHVTQFAISKETQDLDSVKVFVVGNPEAGKTTLVRAICKHKSGIIPRITNAFKFVKGVDLSTSGIIPTPFYNKDFGSVVFFDFAGQFEYYSGHAAMLENTIITSPSVFLIVVDITEDTDKLFRQLCYWLCFIDNCCTEGSKMHVAIIGSHADILKARNKDIPTEAIEKALIQFSESFHYEGYVTLNCRRLVSRGLDDLFALLATTCNAVRITGTSDFRCHVLYAFMNDKFLDSTACYVEQLSTTIQEEDVLLPHEIEKLLQLLQIMSEKGKILLLKNQTKLQHSWIVLHKETLLKEVNGTVFAPNDGDIQNSFRQFSTGVVPLSKIKQSFPQHDYNMITSFLVQLEFCQKIEDNSLQNIISGIDMSNTSSAEEYFFFPAFVSVDQPTAIWQYNEVMDYKCGWCLQCTSTGKFLTPRFLHILLLRLAFQFALATEEQGTHPVIQRCCSVWKNGIQWMNRDGVETIVAVEEQNSCVTMMMQCEKGKELQLIYLRSQVIKTVLTCKNKFCLKVPVSESFIDPTDLQYPLRSLKHLNHYSVGEIAKAIMNGNSNAFNNKKSGTINIEKLLFFEPYMGLERQFLELLFTLEEDDQPISEQCLALLGKQNYKKITLYEEMINPNALAYHEECDGLQSNPSRKCMILFKLWRNREGSEGTLMNLREKLLNLYSIFCGRNLIHNLAPNTSSDVPTANEEPAPAAATTI